MECGKTIDRDSPRSTMSQFYRGRLSERLACLVEITSTLFLFVIMPYSPYAHPLSGCTRTRTNTNPNDTEAGAAGRSGNARALIKQKKCGMIQEVGGGVGQIPRKFCEKKGNCGCCAEQ